MTTKKQQQELRKVMPEIKDIHNILSVVKHSGQMPVGKNFMYSRLKTQGLLKMRYKTTKTGHRVMDRPMLTKKGKSLLESFRIKNDVFVNHIENHLRKMYADDHIVREVCCKICNKTIDEIYKEEK